MIVVVMKEERRGVEGERRDEERREREKRERERERERERKVGDFLSNFEFEYGNEEGRYEPKFTIL
jgi:hypothetical protein